jgi:hypothetical protein
LQIQHYKLVWKCIAPKIAIYSIIIKKYKNENL